MRDVDGLLPQDAFDELIKFLFYKEHFELRYGETYPRPLPLTAREIRRDLSRCLSTHAPWTQQLWPDGMSQLSDQTLLDLHQLFADIQLNQTSLDVRSTALQTFLSPEVRKGLGIFTTPEVVVRFMIELLEPKSSDVIVDPACGTGTFLLETARFLATKIPRPQSVTLLGVDKNPRMLVLASLNLGCHPGIVFERTCSDSLRELGRPNIAPLGLTPDSADLILTNPPFGVTVAGDVDSPDLFGMANSDSAQARPRIPSEILFVELCLRVLKPGGHLGIILPRSVITNKSVSQRRRVIDQLGYVSDIVDLPAETFAQTGTQTTTVAAFFRKHETNGKRKPVSVRVSHVTNVGYDTTGRQRQGNQLPNLAARLKRDSLDGEPTTTIHDGLSSTETLQRAAIYLFRRNGRRRGRRLQEFVALANTGRTPSRKSYTDFGTFILKVGNLTGHGIDWQPRERNFVSQDEGLRRSKTKDLITTTGDILLTSSAHAARYIAKKVDIILDVPKQYGVVTFVGELIRLRPTDDIDPFLLLAALRHPSVRDDLQACVRGQTAHLNPEDLLSVFVPHDLRSPPESLVELADTLRRQAKLAYELSQVSSTVSELVNLAEPSHID